MPIRKIAVIAVDNPAEVTSFAEWLSRNRAMVIGMSENEGCGCCVDVFQMELEDCVEPMPCESGGEFDESVLKFGEDREEIITAFLHHRIGNLEYRIHTSRKPHRP